MDLNFPNSNEQCPLASMTAAADRSWQLFKLHITCYHIFSSLVPI